MRLPVRSLLLPSTLLAAFAASSAHAQNPAQRNAYGVMRTVPTGTAETVVCGSTTQVRGVGTTSALCSTASANFDALGYDQPGRVGARAASSASGLTEPTTATAFAAKSDGWWADRLTFTGAVTPASVHMNVLWEGYLEANATGHGNSVAGLARSFSANNSSGAVLAFLNDIQAVSAAGRLNNTWPEHNSLTFVDPHTFTLNLLTPTPYIDFRFSVDLEANSTTPISGQDIRWSADAFADFTHTGELTGLSFFDTAGNDITSDVQYTFRDGTVLPSAVTETPEPATASMLAAGVLALGLAAVRRRRGRAA